jgi:hypothetical protein
MTLTTKHLRGMLSVEPLWFSFYGAVAPACHESCFLNYFVVMWALGENFATTFRLGMN